MIPLEKGRLSAIVVGRNETLHDDSRLSRLSIEMLGGGLNPLQGGTWLEVVSSTVVEEAHLDEAENHLRESRESNDVR